MKAFLLPCPRLSLVGVLTLWMTGAPDLCAQSTRHHHKGTPAPDVEVEDATLAPKTRRQKSVGDDKPTAAATPVPKKEDTAAATSEKAPDEKLTSADEAAPSKATTPAAGNPAKNAASAAAVSSIEPSEIEGFDSYPEPIHKLLADALELTKRNLTYTYGSTDPDSGGLDCSGTVYYLLNKEGFSNVPRQANEQYDWVRQKSRFYAVLSKRQDNFELKEMRPGDLLFWTGTYRVDRDPPVTHTMIYLGKRKSDGQRIMFGASDGRPYNGERRNGVSVFDFKMPAARNGDAADAATAATPAQAPDFSGYGPIPGMTDLADAAGRQTMAAKGGATDQEADRNAASKAEASSTPKPKKPRSGRRAQDG